MKNNVMAAVIIIKVRFQLKKATTNKFDNSVNKVRHFLFAIMNLFYLKN